ncbi:hypothetical protein F4803DRAFT_564378 [Xylaria telfairii]|nr:hypothetical protein F4803DRAFT_564378 [Xylaria telfairii]
MEVLVQEASADQNYRKFVVKYSYGNLALDEQSDADNDLRNEYQYLKRLRGAEHIVQLIDFPDCSLNLPGISDGEATYEESVQKQKDEAAAAAADGSQPTTVSPIRRCPTLAIEYITYGTAYDFKKRVHKSGKFLIPSQLLWKIWLCLVRQCVAMAFPPDIPDDQYVGQLIREVMEDRPYAFITQNSPHLANFLFNGTTDIPGDEHEPDLPLVKLIDFGRGRIEDGESESALRRSPDSPEEYANKKNLSGAADVLMRLCCLDSRREQDFQLHKNPIPYTWTDETGTHTTQTRAPRILRTNIFIDDNLRHLLARVMAHPYALKPSLREVLSETEKAIARGPDHQSVSFLVGGAETADTVRSYVQEWIYDA